MRQVRQGASWSGGERNRVFLHGGVKLDGTPQFTDVSALSGMDFLDDARSIGVTDWDHDGDLDVWLRNRTAPRLRLMLNQHVTEGVTTDFVALHLLGTTSNRDAIGARVALKLEDQTLIQTVRAGGTFLSQSSKWLHFGLASANEIQEVSVRWPNGHVEIYENIKPGQRIILKEGTGTGRALGNQRRVTLRSGTLALAQDDQTSILPRNVLAPDFSFLPETQGPLWMILWSQTCPHCQEELRAVTASAAILKKAGLTVCAVSLKSDPTNGYLKQIGYPFHSAVVDETIFARIQGLQSSLFDQPPPLAVPLSLLMGPGPERSIVAIFRGVAGPDKVLAHLSLTHANEDQLRDHAAPYAGQWYTKPHSPATLLEYLGEKMHPHDRVGSAFYYEKAGLVETAARIYYDVGMATTQQPAQAERAFRKAIALNPTHAKAHNNLGALLANQNRFEEAASCFERALKHEPDNEKARLNLKRLEQLR
ncbi:MAG: hypothetical protein ACI8T1_001570 [Verrucomicrobiales bacterium]|jgi:hypothetical protein